MGKGPDHRGSIDDPVLFARKFVLARLSGFEKDIDICLTPVPSNVRPGNTHAYFPALGTCCGTIEYLTALRLGRINGIGWRQVADWAREFLPQPDYDTERVRILINAFRHPVAHRGIASGVWIDQNPQQGNGRRLTWKVLADARCPAVQIVAENGELKKDQPWPCRYTHRVHIHLKAMKVDIRDAAKRYISALKLDAQLQRNFLLCMRQLYPM